VVHWSPTSTHLSSTAYTAVVCIPCIIDSSRKDNITSYAASANRAFNFLVVKMSYIIARFMPASLCLQGVRSVDNRDGMVKWLDHGELGGCKYPPPHSQARKL
jgi:hypothetical protein